MERISSEVPTNQPDNWKSAASTAGFATPGQKNSHARIINTNTSMLSIEPTVILPNNDGFADFATINFEFKTANNIATAIIYDAHARPVKTLLNNASLPAEGFITWDGTNNDLQKVRIGSYVVIFHVFNELGEVFSLRERIGVASTF